MARESRLDSNNIKPQQGDGFDLSEVRDDPDAITIDVASPRDHAHFLKLLEETKLSEEIVEIVVTKAPEKNALAVVTPNVNGVNQPIVRGVPTRVKLKYVLALAYSKQASFERDEEEATRNPTMGYETNTTQCYPFEVRRCSDNARAMIEHALAQPL